MDKIIRISITLRQDILDVLKHTKRSNSGMFGDEVMWDTTVPNRQSKYPPAKPRALVL